MRQRAGIRVRQYILEMIYNAAGREILLPSAAEFAGLLGVSRSTVTGVMKELQDYGYIRGVNGVGTFSNPWMLQQNGASRKSTVGLIYGDGRAIMYDSFAWNMMSAIGNSVLNHRDTLTVLHTSGHNEGAIFGEIHEHKFDTLVWITPWHSSAAKEFVTFMRNSQRGIIMVPYDNMVPHSDTESFAGLTSSVCLDYYQAGKEFAKALLAEGRKTLYYIFDDRNDATRIKGIEDACAEAGAKLNIRIFPMPRDRALYVDLEDALKSGKCPDAIFAYGENLKSVQDICGRHGVDTRERCRLLAESHQIDPADFNGYAMEMDFRSLGENVADLADRMREDHTLAESVRIPCTVRAYGTARK